MMLEKHEKNLHLANFSNLYLRLGDLEQAKKYHNQIIPSKMDIERRLSWELNAGKIDMFEKIMRPLYLDLQM